MSSRVIFEHGSISITSYEPPEGSGQPPYVELWYRTQLISRERLTGQVPLARAIGSALPDFPTRLDAARAVAYERADHILLTHSLDQVLREFC